MRILIVNDDGYTSPGIIKLAAALHAGHQVTVVAPKICYSGYSHAMTFHKPIYVKKVDDFDFPCLSVIGTPADCVKFGLEVFGGNLPDLIISGINNTPNIGTDVVYSGTVNAAVEGALNGIRSVALSGDVKTEEDFDYIVDFFIKHFDFYMRLVKPDSPISININGAERGNKGHKICPLGVRKFSDLYISGGEDERGQQHTLVGEPLELGNNPDCDVEWFAKGYATVTPIEYEMSDFARIAELKKIALSESDGAE
jgi:5'-nucleotidase